MLSESRLLRCLLCSGLAAVSLGLSAAHSSAQDTPPIVQLLNEPSITFSSEDQTITVVGVNVGEAQLIRSAPAGDLAADLRIQAGPATGTQQLTCDQAATGQYVETANEVPTGNTVEIHAKLCAKPAGQQGSISVWGAKGGGLTRIAVSAGTKGEAARKPDLPTAITLTGTTNERVSESFCLSSDAQNRQAQISGENKVAIVSFKPAEEANAKCPTGTSATDVSVNSKLDTAGKYTGTADLNGAAEGGNATITVSTRDQLRWFLIPLGIGFLLASFLGWWLSAGRDWSALKIDEMTMRANAWEAQETLRAEPSAAVPAELRTRWNVVSEAAPERPTRALDRLLDVLRPRRLDRLRAVPAEKLKAGSEYKSAEDAVASYVKKAEQARRLLELADRLQRQTLVPPTDVPTLTNIKLVFVRLENRMPEALPEANTVEDLSKAIDDVATQVNTFSQLLALATDLLSNPLLSASERGKIEDVRRQVLRCDYSDSTAVQKVRAALADFRDRPGPPDRLLPGDIYGALLGEEFVRQANLEGFAAPQDGGGNGLELELSRTRAHRTKVELAVVALSGLIAALSAWATLYASNTTWGTAADYVLALTWAVTVQSALQLARYFPFPVSK